MRDPSTFEARLTDALDRFSETALADRERAEIVRVATQTPRLRGTWRRTLLDGPRLAAVPLLLLLVLAILVAVVAVGSQLLRPPALVDGPRQSPSPSQAALRTSLLDMSVTVLVDGRVLFLSAGNAPTTWDPSTGQLTASGEHPPWPPDAYEASPAILLRDGRVLSFGTSLEASLYDPAIGHLQPTGSMETIHQTCHCGVKFYGLAHPQMTLLHDGRVLVSGGAREAELYDPVTGTFSYATPGVPCNASRGPAALLRDGRVLVLCLEPDGRAGAAIYDPVAEAYAAAGPRVTTNAGAATVLSDGRVLITGQGLWASVDPAEIYDPATNTFRRLSSRTNPNPYDAVLRLSDGRVLFIRHEPDRLSGYANPGETVLFDPVSETFAPVDPPVLGESPVQLRDGRVLVLQQGTIALFDPSQWH